jgi:hypothetical protein
MSTATANLLASAKGLLQLVTTRLQGSKLDIQNPLAPAAAVAVSYWLLVRVLRYRRRNSFARRFGYRTRESLKHMTLDDAYLINKELAEQEFPLVFQASIFFALLKTYGIPTISKLLAATDQLSGERTASKRTADTGTIMSEVILTGPRSERAMEAIARMNFLHARYRKSGKILDVDLLYTLSLFALEPIRWTDKYDWRRLTELEKCAIGVFWQDVGRAMEIPYDVLEPMLGGRTDGLSWLNAMDKWSRQYEVDEMVPTDSNEKVAKRTVWIALFHVPDSMKGFFERIVSVVLEPRLRIATRYAFISFFLFLFFLPFLNQILL